MTVSASADTGAGQHDIVIVGGGLVGGPLALALASAGWDVALVERQTSLVMPADSLDQHCTALAASSVDWLRGQGLWESLGRDATPIRQVHVSHRGRFGAVRLDALEQRVDALGHVIENRQFLHALAPLLKSSPVHSCTGDAVASVHPFDKDILVKLESGNALSARLLIATDGVTSTVREALGIGIRQVDYEQAAVLGTLRLNSDHQETAYERFTDSGPLALLPRPDRCMSFVECIETGAQDRLGSLSDRDYCRHLQERFGHRLGRFAEMGPRSIVPLVRIEANVQTGPRTLLLGNAARLLHPVAGQGYNLALRDAAGLLETLHAAQLSGTGNTVVAHVPDPGGAELLDMFTQSRRSDQKQVVAMTDLLARSFRGSTTSHARALALMGIDTIGPLRRGFAQRCMGMTG